jgi:hypothetical protein
VTIYNLTNYNNDDDKNKVSELTSLEAPPFMLSDSDSCGDVPSLFLELLEYSNLRGTCM